MPKNLADWLFDLENRHQQEIQLGLTRILTVAKKLCLLNPCATIITVAGTNGKGSTVALLESIYYHAGYTVASYTSPHLIEFNERIKINKQAISDNQLIHALEVVENARGSTELTYFEMVTLAALWHFKQHTLDLIILEVGLGGRLDATNIINADLAIITTIDYDHQDYLGDTIEAIGYEKAGIIRAGKPMIYADNNPPLSILTQAASLGTICYINGREYHYQTKDNELYFCYQGRTSVFPRTRFHNNSVMAVIMATICLQTNLVLNDEIRQQGINNTALSGRLQVVKGRQTTILDVAHNPQAAHYLAHFIKELNCGGKVHAVFASFSDKDIAGLIAPMRAIVDYWYPVQLSSKRAASPQQLIAAFTFNGISVSMCHNNPELAYQFACNQAAANDLIIVYGSFVMVGPVLSILSNAHYS